MARSPCDLRILLLAAAAAFIYIQEKIVALEEMKIRQDEERVHLKILIQDLEKRSVRTLVNNNVAPVAAVVVMACNRPDYLQRTVESILKYQTSVASKFPLFISQDGINGEVKKKALSYNEITYMQHLDLEPVHTERPGELIAYYKIAKHYKWALDELFIKHNFARGSSMGQFFRQYLEPIKLNDAHIKWNSEDLSYLKEDKFLIQFGKDVASATPLHGSDAVLKAHNMDADVRIQYNDQEDFERIARQFGIFEEWKDGIPRTAYKGVVVFRYKSSRRRIYLVGPDSLSQLRFLNWTFARMKGNEILIDI
uniref:Alpha-1,3-mannosyl-glycoprotein 2-beta-N-acetylglucosaminyltransferase n=1 Tax=Oryza glumipatula TaxID=40148 RepID=A0A0D9Z0N0_9ORYZ